MGGEGGEGEVERKIHIDKVTDVTLLSKHFVKVVTDLPKS